MPNGNLWIQESRNGKGCVSMSIIKVHTNNGAELYLNSMYIVKFIDNMIVVDDYVRNPDFLMPESKTVYEVFETADEIKGLIDGTIDDKKLDDKYAEQFNAAAREGAEKYPF